MNILVTGSDGYIGSILVPILLKEGHSVTGLDTGYYREGCLYNISGVSPITLNKDIRKIKTGDLAGFDTVIHMAELSNDPTSQMFPDITLDINHKASVHLARLAKDTGVSRFIYTSSCSVYGLANKDVVSEESEVNPQTTYAKCKVMVEQDVSKLADSNFSPTFLRNATAFGASPRMRFDLVLNNLCGWAWTNKEINVTSDGTPWRPLVHILDICKAILCVLHSPIETVHNETFNVGDTLNNFQVKDIAEIVAQKFLGSELSFGTSDGDNRSYRVSFDKINQKLKGFSCDWDLLKGVEQLHGLFNQINLSEDIFQFRPYIRLKQLEYLINTNQIDRNLFWVN